jgi:energy-coupling factor transporter ATP-binding protein EcfA2
MSEERANDPTMDPELLDRIKKTFEGRGAIISIAGPDGAGKTTLAGHLVEVFAHAGLPAQRIHCYAWYKNVFVMPFRLSKLKRNTQIIILDRSIYDNVIEISRRIGLPASVRRYFIRAVTKFYTAFEYKTVLTAPISVLSARRPDEDKTKIAQQVELYLELSNLADYKHIVSEGSISEMILHAMVEPKFS